MANRFICLLSSRIAPAFRSCLPKSGWNPALSLLLAVTTLATSQAWGHQPSLPAPDKLLDTLKQAHPRLLATSDDFAKLRQAIHTDPVLKQWHVHLMKQAEHLKKSPPLEMSITTGHRVVLQGMGPLRHRLFLCSLMYQLHGEQAYVDLAWRDMQAAIALPEWNTRHFLGVAETARAMAVAYDWMHQALTADQRQTLADTLLDKAIEPALRAYRGQDIHGWWPAVHTNWNQVCNGGIGMAALAIADVHPEPAADALNHILRLLPIAMQSYAPDGAWDEGLAYWGYGGDYNVSFIAALQTALGTDFGLADAPGFDLTGFYPLHFTGPTRMSANFGDTPRGYYSVSAAQLWLARRFDKPGLARFQIGRTAGSPMDMIWYDADLARRAREWDPNLRPLDIHLRQADLFAFRSAWDDPQATWIAFKAGDNKANHAHLDLGTFLFEALGHRWADDPGSDSYNLPGYFGRDRWLYYRMRTESHNTLLLNPSARPGQHLRASAKVLDYRVLPDGQGAQAVMDLTAAYANQPPAPSLVRRTITRRGTAAIIEDHIRTDHPQATSAYWLMHTPARVDPVSDGVMLTIDDARVHVKIISPPGAAFDISQATPLPTSPNPPGQGDNKALTRLSLPLGPALAQGQVDVRVELIPQPR